MLMSQLLHPHPEAPKIDLKGQQLAGALLISPWVIFDSSATSTTSNLKYDFVSQSDLLPKARWFVPANEEDDYNIPLNASPEWWKGLPVKNILVTAGDYEIFRDDIAEIVKKMRVHNPELEYFVGPAEIHVESAVVRGLKMPIAATEKHFVDWILRRL